MLLNVQIDTMKTNRTKNARNVWPDAKFATTNSCVKNARAQKDSYFILLDALNNLVHQDTINLSRKTNALKNVPI